MLGEERFGWLGAASGRRCLGGGVLRGLGAGVLRLDLLRWHGAEEVEHRSLVFDVHEAVGGRYLQRASTMLVAAPIFAAWWISGVRYLLAHDPSLQGRRFGWREYWRAARQRRLPTPGELLGGLPAYLTPGFNPRQKHSTEMALAYLARSPAARDAAERRAAAKAEGPPRSRS